MKGLLPALKSENYLKNGQESNNSKRSEFEKLSNELLRTMRITTNARFEAAKRLKRINSVCFLSTTLASLGLILIPLLDISKHNKVFSNESLTVFQIFLAVCVLVYSATISTANFSLRSKEFLECGDKIKSIVNEFKLHIIEMRDLDQPPELKKYTDLYTKVLIGTENHEDIDYLKALSSYNKKINIKKEYYLITAVISWGKIYLPFFILMIFELLFIGDMLGYWEVLKAFHH